MEVEQWMDGLVEKEEPLENGRSLQYVGLPAAQGTVTVAQLWLYLFRQSPKT